MDKENENKKIDAVLTDDEINQSNVPAVKTCSEMEKEIARIAKENNWEVNEVSLDAIVMAKLKNFGLENWGPCPCDANNNQRYCGSPLCVEEVKENGVCVCGLFKLPENS